MEVTRKNFKEAMPLVADSIKKADFLVIDAEFTGLINGRDVSIFDSPQEYYNRIFNGCTEFLLIQYGLCAFYWDEDLKHYKNDAYNFYLFPRGRPGPERMFLCQSSSLDFLASQGFDFNKVIKEGISYMTEPTETRLRECLLERQKLYNSDKDIITIPEENKQHIDDICKRVRLFLDENKSDEMELEWCNAFIRRLLFQELGARFKKEAFIESKILDNKSRVLKVTRLKSANEAKSRDDQKKKKEWQEFEDAVGFSKVARMISQSEKLVIGHNMLLDVIHTLNHFFQPLPPNYSSFKEFAHCMFPRILDTKYMSSLPPFKDKVSSTVLQHLLATLSEPPFSLPTAVSQQGRGYSKAEDKQHEAGYDAYVTGLCFLAMHAHLARMRGESYGRVAGASSACLKPFVNKLFLAKTAHQDSPYMNLAGDDPTPSRDHVFHLTFPKEWQRNDINLLFSPFGPITVQFLEDNRALVALSRRDAARDVMRAMGNNKRVQLVSYAHYKQPAKIQKEIEDNRRNLVVPNASTPDIGVRVNRANAASSGNSPRNIDRGEKVERERSVSVTNPPSTSPVARKRTSSGVFQVDDAEPPPKKIVLKRSSSDSGTNITLVLSEKEKNSDVASNRRRKTEGDKEPVANEGKAKVIERFDTDAKAKCVSAFKESDSWD